MRVKILWDTSSFDLEALINEFLDNELHESRKVIDIKYSMTSDENDYAFSALVMWE